MSLRKYFLTIWLLPLGCGNPADDTGSITTIAGNWSKVATITKFNNDTNDYTGNIFELHFCDHTIWTQYLRTGTRTKKYVWEYEIDNNFLYRYFPSSLCGSLFKIHYEQDTLFVEDSLMIHKWVKYDSTDIPALWKPTIVEITIDSVEQCK